MRSQNRESFHPSQFIGDQVRAHLARSYLFPFDMASVGHLSQILTVTPFLCFQGDLFWKSSRGNRGG